MSNNPIIKIEGLSKTFGNRTGAITALIISTLH